MTPLKFFLSISTRFLSSYNLKSLGLTVAIATIVGFSQLMVLSIGHFNLAIGSMGALAGIFIGALLESYGVPVYISIMLGIIVGSLLGAIQGLIIAKTGIEGKKSVCGKLR